MKRISLLLSLMLTSLLGFCQLKVVDNAVKVDPNAAQSLAVEWPKYDADGNRNPKQVLVVVNYKGFPDKEIGNTVFEFGTINPNRKENLTTFDGKELTFIYLPLETSEITIKHPTFGPARVSLPRLKDKNTYTLQLLVDQRLDIDIEPLTDYESVEVCLDKYQTKASPARFNNVSLGKHNVTFTMRDGRIETRIIDVTPQSGKFNEVTNPDLDLRKRVPVRVESTIKDVTIYVDDQKAATGAPATLQLPSGNHTIKAVSNRSDRVSDVGTVAVSTNAGNMVLKLTPRERHTFRVTANFENINMVPMMLYVGKEEAYKLSQTHAKGERRSYLFDLPVGETYKFRATYQGNEGKQSIKVSPDMAYDQTIIIKRRRQIVWPWEREYTAPPMGITVAYVQKQYKISGEDGEIYKGTLVPWDEAEGGNGKYLHGIKAGVQYQPSLKIGLGLYTGLFWEYYRSHTSQYNVGDDGLTSDFCKYQEHSLTLPVQVFYNFPFASKVALAVHGGANFNYMLSRQLSGYVIEEGGIRFEDSYNMLSDKDEYFPYFPSAFQALWEIGLQLRLGPVMLGAQFARPIAKHKFEIDGAKYTTSTIKNSISLTYVF